MIAFKDPANPLADIAEIAWKSIDLKYTVALMSVGCLALSNNEILLFGGVTGIGEIENREGLLKLSNLETGEGKIEGIDLGLEEFGDIFSLQG